MYASASTDTVLNFCNDTPEKIQVRESQYDEKKNVFPDECSHNIMEEKTGDYEDSLIIESDDNDALSSINTIVDNAKHYSSESIDNIKTKNNFIFSSYVSGMPPVCIDNQSGSSSTVHETISDNVAALKCKSGLIEALKTPIEYKLKLKKKIKKQQNINFFTSNIKFPKENKGSQPFIIDDFLQRSIKSNEHVTESEKLNENAVKHESNITGKVSVRLTSETLRILESAANSEYAADVTVNTVLQGSSQTASCLTDGGLTKEYDAARMQNASCSTVPTEDFFWKVKLKADEIRKSEGKKLQKTAHFKAEERFQRIQAQAKERNKAKYTTDNRSIYSDLSEDDSSSGSSGDSTHGIVNGTNDVSGMNMCENPSDLWYGLKMQNGKPVEIHQNCSQRFKKKLKKRRQHSRPDKTVETNKINYIKERRGNKWGKIEVNERTVKKKECIKYYNNARFFRNMQAQSRNCFNKFQKPYHSGVVSKYDGESLRTVYFSNFNSNSATLTSHCENRIEQKSSVVVEPSNIRMYPIKELRQKKRKTKAPDLHIHPNYVVGDYLKFPGLSGQNRNMKGCMEVSSSAADIPASSMKLRRCSVGLAGDSANTITKRRTIVSYSDLEGCEAPCSNVLQNEKLQINMNTVSNPRNTNNEYVQLHRKQVESEQRYIGCIRESRKTNKRESKSLRVQRLLAERRGLLSKPNMVP